MKKLLIAMGCSLVIGIAAAGLVADEQEDERGAGNAYLLDPGHARYVDECAGCHMAYPPFMLPESSWRRMMGSLADHFGDNAELDAATAAEITDYLARNAAGIAGGEHGERTWRATRDRSAPLRITDTDYFRGQHHEIPAKLVADNPQVVSFSRCEACHGGAERGDFSEHGVRIPGYGRWDD